jgi:uncharacterized repeat protein (TIGR03806 family)
LFVAEQAAKLYSFRNDPNCDHAEMFLDIPKQIRTIDAAGPAKTVGDCYGLTFHPEFEKNRYCYVCYIVNGADPSQPLQDGTRVSRFRVTETDPPRCDPASEEIIITWLAGGHNGGCLAFGPDGYLYISTGDATAPNPPDGLDAGQDLTRLLSGVLRIDVDHRDSGRQYSIPTDNPFISLAGARPEKYAYGFRNPWKMSFDRKTGDLWVGDVGWELWELVYHVERGGNYGWSIMEGPQPVKPGAPRGPTPINSPVIALAHSEAASVTGGYVYHGSKFQELEGAYIFGDWETRRLWAARWDGSKITSRLELAEPSIRIVAFGEANDGELFILDYDDGTIHQLVRNDGERADQDFPRKLSETGLFDSVARLRPAPGVMPFSVNVEQWADNATAERLIALPGYSSVTVHKDQVPVPGTIMQTKLGWPQDAVLVKTVSLELERGRPESQRRIETQLLHYDGRTWRAYSYRWNEDQTDAQLVENEGRDDTFIVIDSDSPGGHRRVTYNFAARASCMRCHNPWAQHSLAFNLPQVTRSHDYNGAMHDQIKTLEHISVLTHATTEEGAQSLDAQADDAAQHAQTPLANPYDSAVELNRRARSYLHVNCAHCHQMGAGGTAEIDLRFNLPIERTKTVGVRPVQGTFGIHDAQIIAPGDPFRSVLFYRISKLGGGRMPHIGSDMIDPRGVELIHDWIQHMPARGKELAALERLRELGDETEPSGDRETSNGISVAERARLRAKDRTDLVEQLLSNTTGAMLLAYEIKQGRIPAGVREQVIEKGIASNESQVRDLFERFVPDERRSARLGSVIRPEKLLLVSGDAGRGRELFFNTPSVACKNCHRISDSGSNLGPELTHIAAKYNKAQILESILEPSKTIDPKYVTYLVETTQGRVLTGLLVEKTSEVVVLRDAKDELIRIPSADMQQCVPQRQSLMPELLLRDMTEQQVADLLEFLNGLK